MNKKPYKYIYGPVPSWRLGASLGIDPVSRDEKICSFDCVYCQLWKTKHFSQDRMVFVQTQQIIEELNSLPSLHIDYITFSGIAEPTLAKNLGEMIKAVKKNRKEKIAVLTNSTLLDKHDVQDDLMNADLVVAKLDASSQDIFTKINRPMENISFEKIVNALCVFRNIFSGKLALQIMFFKENREAAEDIALLAKKIAPDEVQLNTPLRPCGVEPLSQKEMRDISVFFQGLNTVSVYETKKKKIRPISDADTLKRRGKI